MGVVTAPAPAPPAADERSDRGRTAIALGVWALLLLVARLWGKHILSTGLVIRLHAPPLVGWDDWRLGWRVLLPLAVGTFTVVAAPRLAAQVRWRTLLLGAMVLSAVWSVALAVSNGPGWEGVIRPLVLPGDEYILDVPNVGDVGDFLRNFTDQIDTYVVHVTSHPPGMLLLLWSMDRIGLGGTTWAAILCIGGGAAAVPAVLLSVRHLAGEAMARAAAPFVAVAPAAVWIATTADAMYAGVGAWSATAVVFATDRRDRTGDVLAAAGGLGFGVLLMFNYGLALLGLLPLFVAVHRRRVRPIVVAGAVAAVVLGAFALAGFWWVDGFFASKEMYDLSVARTRPLEYFAVANLATVGIVIGPAIAVGLARLRDRRLWLLLAGPIVAMAVADVSRYSKGEVERIWLPFTVWLLAAGAALAGRRSLSETRGWLALQVGFAILLQVAIRTRW